LKKAPVSWVGDIIGHYHAWFAGMRDGDAAIQTGDEIAVYENTIFIAAGFSQIMT
jgi:hypothetical protein